MIDELVKTVKDTKAALDGLVTKGIEDFASGIGGEAGAAFRDAAIEEASQVKNKNKSRRTNRTKGAPIDEKTKDRRTTSASLQEYFKIVSWI